MDAISERNPGRPLADGQIPNRAYLESMTTSDLIKMADELGIDIPPDLDRIFIIGELLEINSFEEMEEDVSAASDTPVENSTAPENQAGTTAEARGAASKRRAFPDTEMAESGLVESVPLPKHYNITFIEVMIRDPLWAFVFWEIKGQDKEQFEKAQDFEGYYLKVSPCSAATNNSASTPADKSVQGVEGEKEIEGVFTITVTSNDTAWYLGLNPAIEQRDSHLTQQYKVELCAGMKGGETVLAVSNAFKLPHLHESSAGGENPFASLSGYGDFHILRNNERITRAKRSASSSTHE